MIAIRESFITLNCLLYKLGLQSNELIFYLKKLEKKELIAK